MDLKKLAAKKAVEYIKDSDTLGLGTGSSSDAVLQEISELILNKCLDHIKGVPTSARTEDLALSLGIPLCTLEKISSLDLTIDGTDEFDSSLNLLKGHGGALTREKIAARNSKQYIIVADASKRVKRLGSRVALPVEVLPFGWAQTAGSIEKLGARIALRKVAGSPYRTDQGNFILDCTLRGGIENPTELDDELKLICGVVEHGLFLGMADKIIIASETGIEVLERENS